MVLLGFFFFGGGGLTEIVMTKKMRATVLNLSNCKF